MNILFFLTPKSQVAYVMEDFTLRQVAEKLTFHHYTAIPILSKDGKYIGTISEGDLFRYIKDHDQLNYRSAENTPILDVPIERDVETIRFDAKMDDLYHMAWYQNFVPVIDDNGIFIGIVTRSAIMGYFCKPKEDSKSK